MANSHHTHPAQSAQKSTYSTEDSVCVICAWCGDFIGGDPNGTIISHGICGPCKEAQLAKLEQPSRAIPQSWYTIKTPDFTARVDRESGKITYGW